jgi:hypothetical protein
MATKVRHHLDHAAGFHISHVRAEMAELTSVNAKIALAVTKFVGSMWCAYLFCLIALASLPAILVGAGWVGKGTFPSWLITASLISIVAWIAQTFIQLVLLSVIMVGQDVQSHAADARSVDTENNTKRLIDLLDIETEGGIKAAVDKILAALPK